MVAKKHYYNHEKDVSSIIMNNYNKTKLSIIIPVFNSERYLRQCLNSVIDQSLKEIEVIVVNDGSNDSSLNVIKDAADRDPRIKIINNEKPSGNPGTPRNQAIAFAKGEYIGFVDSDDWIEPEMFEKMYMKAIEEYYDIVILNGFINETGNISEIRKYNGKYLTDDKSMLHRYHPSCFIWDKIYKKSFIYEYNLKLAEIKGAVDVPFVLSSYLAARSIGFCDGIYYHYRRNSEGSITVKHRINTNCAFEFEAYRLTDKWLNDNKFSDRYADIINLRKIKSYLYTMDLVKNKHFKEYYSRVQEQFRNIQNTKKIKQLFSMLKEENNYNEFETIIEFSWLRYFVAKRTSFFKFTNYCKEVYIAFQNKAIFILEKLIKRFKILIPSNVESRLRKFYREKVKYYNIKPVSKIFGKNRGVIFFPDWSLSNPYQILLYQELNKKFDIFVHGFRDKDFTVKCLKKYRKLSRIVHFHWIHTFIDASDDLSIKNFFSTIHVAKKLDYKIIWTVHNLVSHENNDFEQEIAFRKKFVHLCDYIFVHGLYAKKIVIESYCAPDNKVYIVPHGSYYKYYPDTIKRSDARDFLSINNNEFVFLFFGYIRGYKGLEELIDSFIRVNKSHHETRLIIAGRSFDKNISEYIDCKICSNPMIMKFEGYVDDFLVQYYFRAANILVLPYRKILTSGAAILSLSFKTPIIAPCMGLIPELIDEKLGCLFSDYKEMESIMHKCVESWEKGEFEKRYNHQSFEKKLQEIDWKTIVDNEIFKIIFS